MFALKVIVTLTFISEIYCEYTMVPTYDYLYEAQPQPEPNQQPQSAVSRQIFDMIDIVTDVAMITLLGIPVVGLLAIGANAIAPLLSTKKNARSKREIQTHLFNKFKPTLKYFGDIVNVLIDIDDAFDKYGVYDSECQHRVICEAHQSVNDSKLASNLLELLRIQRKLIEKDYFAISKFIFSGFEAAANSGEAKRDCAAVYSQCPFNLNYFASKKAII